MIGVLRPTVSANYYSTVQEPESTVITVTGRSDHRFSTSGPSKVKTRKSQTSDIQNVKKVAYVMKGMAYYERDREDRKGFGRDGFGRDLYSFS